jgi:hypothetical protein
MTSKYLPITDSCLSVAVNTVAVSGKENRPTRTECTFSHAWEHNTQISLFVFYATANILPCLSSGVQLYIVIKQRGSFLRSVNHQHHLCGFYTFSLPTLFLCLIYVRHVLYHEGH